MTISHFEERHISLPSILKPFLNFMRLKTARGESSPNNNADIIRTKAADGSIDNKEKDKIMKDGEKNFKNFSSSKSKDVSVSSVDTLSLTSEKKSKKEKREKQTKREKKAKHKKKEEKVKKREKQKKGKERERDKSQNSN